MEKNRVPETPQPEPTIFGKVVKAYRAFGEDASDEYPGGTWLAPIMWAITVISMAFSALVCTGAVIKFLGGTQ